MKLCTYFNHLMIELLDYVLNIINKSFMHAPFYIKGKLCNKNKTITVSISNWYYINITQLL